MIWIIRDAWKVDHTTGETYPTPCEQECGFFYVPFDFTNERRMKETRPITKRHHPITRSFQLRQGLKSQPAYCSGRDLNPRPPARQTGALPTKLTKRRLWLETEKKTFLFVFVSLWIKMNLRPLKLLRWIVSLVSCFVFRSVFVEVNPQQGNSPFQSFCNS